MKTGRAGKVVLIVLMLQKPFKTFGDGIGVVVLDDVYVYQDVNQVRYPKQKVLDYYSRGTGIVLAIDPIRQVAREDALVVLLVVADAVKLVDFLI